MRVLGLDPGTVGAIAVLDGTDVLLLDDLPVHQIGTSTRKATRPELDLHQLHAMLTEHAPFAHAFIERVNAMPRQGVTSTFRFGFATGAVSGIITALGIPTTWVLPRDWQAFHRIRGGDDAARQRATQLFPRIAPELARKRDVHRADALLIAGYGLHRLRADITPAENGL